MEVKSKHQSGTSAVEFALLLPILVLLVFGIIEFGLLLYDQAVITNASREGARAGIIQQPSRVTCSEIQTVVTNYSSSYLINFGGADVNFSATGCPCPGFGSNLAVTVTYPYNFLALPLANMNLRARAVMKCE